MTTVNNKKCYPSEKYLNELITNIEFAARAPVEVVRAIAAELQKHRKAYANTAASKDGWISCSERMPENIPGSCKEYLVFDGLNNKVHHDYWVVPDGDSAPVASFWNHYEAHVTHWMPLPEPPQEAK